MIPIVENMVIEWNSLDTDTKYLERILWVSPSSDFVFSINLDDDKAFPVVKTYVEYKAGFESGICKSVNWVNENFPITDESIAKEHADIRDKAWEAIYPIVLEEPDCFDSRLRGVLVRTTVEKTALHKSTVYRYLRRYWQGGKMKNALLPFYNNCGNFGEDKKVGEVKRGRPRKFEDKEIGINIDEETKRLLRSGVRLYYNDKLKSPLKRAYQQTLEKFFVVGYRQEGNAKIPILPPPDQLPTFGQYRYWFNKEMNLEETLKSRHGKKRFELTYRPVLGSSTQESFGPGSRFQIDATIADVYLVSEYRRDWIIGRPVIYVIIDVFSRYITGIYVGLEGPSWIGASMALFNMTTDKVKFCAEYGITISPDEWACHHLPQIITADRGELEGTMPNHLIDNLGVFVENTPPYRADWKGVVEQQFNLLNIRSIKFIPGAVKERIRERGERDYRLDAKLTLREFTQIMIENVLYHNNKHHMRWYQRNEFMVAEDVLPIPRDLWHWGIINRNGKLKTQREDIIKLNLMYSGQATVTAAGIQFKGMHYGCDIALKEQWFVKARAGKTWKVKISYDPRSTNEIYLWLEDGQHFETCTLLERENRYLNKRFEEVEDLLEVEKHQGRAQEVNNMLAKIELDVYTKAIVDEATQKTDRAIKNSTESNAQRIKGSRRHRSEEKQQNRTTEAFRLSDTSKPTDKPVDNVVPISRNSEAGSGKPESSYIPPVNKLSKIKAFLQEDGDEDE